MTPPGLLLGIVAGSLALVASGAASAGEILDRRYVPIPPVYPAPPPGFIPLPSSGAPLILRDPGSRSARPTWSPGRTDVIVGIDGKGRITHALEYTPGSFDR